jgi:hypothetical protein
MQLESDPGQYLGPYPPVVPSLPPPALSPLMLGFEAPFPPPSWTHTPPQLAADIQALIARDRQLDDRVAALPPKDCNFTSVFVRTRRPLRLPPDLTARRRIPARARAGRGGLFRRLRAAHLLPERLAGQVAPRRLERGRCPGIRVRR